MENNDIKKENIESNPFENNNGDVAIEKSKKDKSQKKSQKGKQKKSHWAIKATIITFLMAAFFSFISELTKSSGNVIITLILLVFLIIASIIFDGIGVATASCDIAPLTAMASKKVKGSKTAIKLVNNADIVSNICNDVIGDIFGILSGACTVVIAAKITMDMESTMEKIITIVISAIVSAMIVGGKAALKNYAINNSKNVVMIAAKIIAFFVPEDKKKKKKKKKN